MNLLMSLLSPAIFVDSVLNITPEMLKENNISALLLDVDNTLAVYRTKQPSNGVIEWIENMQKNGILLRILSNAKPKRIGIFADDVKLPYYSLSLKPLPFRIKSAAKKMNVPLNQVALVGDQVFTDILGGNLAGLKSILVEPIKVETSWSFKIKRHFEKSIKSKIQKGE